MLLPGLAVVGDLAPTPGDAVQAPPTHAYSDPVPVRLCGEHAVHPRRGITATGGLSSSSPADRAVFSVLRAWRMWSGRGGHGAREGYRCPRLEEPAAAGQASHRLAIVTTTGACSTEQAPVARRSVQITRARPT
jgi:hypothetical protein